MRRIRILFLAACPSSMTPLALDKEARSIEMEVFKAGNRDMELITKWAESMADLMLILDDVQPDLVHFSGHGTKADEIVFVGNDGTPRALTKSAIDRLFRIYKDKFRLVLLNACFSTVQAQAIVEHIDFAIGMSQEISDKSVIVFAAAFYQGLGFGHSVNLAFERARVTLLLDGIPEDLTPKLVHRDGVDPTEVILGTPPAYRIAVVDDEPAVAAFLRLAFCDSGHTVYAIPVIAGPGDLRREIERIRPDAVILDYKLEPDLTLGALFVRSLRSSEPKLVILYYTSSALDKQIVGELMAAGIPTTDIFMKVDAQLDSERLLRRIDEYNAYFSRGKA